VEKGESKMFEAEMITGTIESNNGSEALVSFDDGAKKPFERTAESKTEFLANFPIMQVQTYNVEMTNDLSAAFLAVLVSGVKALKSIVQLPVTPPSSKSTTSLVIGTALVTIEGWDRRT
jgi:hypothetical protein